MNCELERLKSVADPFELACLEKIEKGEYGLISSFGNFSYCGLTASAVLDAFFMEMPKCVETYSTLIDVWTDAKTGFPFWVFGAMQEHIEEYRPTDYLKDLPADCLNDEVLNIYRGTTEAETRQVILSPSWSLSKDVALFFCSRATAPDLSNSAACLYKAKISKDDIIAYTNERNEQEIIQFGGVFDVEKIPFTQYEVNNAIKHLEQIEEDALKKMYDEEKAGV